MYSNLSDRKIKVHALNVLTNRTVNVWASLCREERCPIAAQMHISHCTNFAAVVSNSIPVLADIPRFHKFQTSSHRRRNSGTTEHNLSLEQGFVSYSVWLPVPGDMSCRPSSTPCAIKLAWSVITTRARSETTLACTQWKYNVLQRLSLMCIIKDLFPPLLPGPKATIVFVVVIDIVFHPYITKQSDHDSDANVEVERVF